MYKRLNKYIYKCTNTCNYTEKGIYITKMYLFSLYFFIYFYFSLFIFPFDIFSPPYSYAYLLKTDTNKQSFFFFFFFTNI